MKKNMVKKVMAGVLTGVMALSSGGSAVYAEESGEKEKITVAIYVRGNLNPEEGSMESNRWTSASVCAAAFLSFKFAAASVIRSNAFFAASTRSALKFSGLL